MLLAIISSLDVVLLVALGWALRRDERMDREKLERWVTDPIPVKISRYTVWKTMAQKAFYEYLDRMVEPNGQNIARHRYVHP